MFGAMADAMQRTTSLGADDLAEMIRRIVREEVSDLLEERGLYARPTIIEPGSPVYEDLVETINMAEAGTLRILTREEALGG